jgi:hypothetical protein
MVRDEIDALIANLAQNPTAGDEMRGTDGCRKVRVGGRGKGKSGGYRTITCGSYRVHCWYCRFALHGNASRNAGGIRNIAFLTRRKNESH